MELVENLYDSPQIDVFVMDSSKVFDKVGHRKLLSKLQECGIKGLIRHRLQQWLHSRTPVVVVDEAQSTEVPGSSVDSRLWTWNKSILLLYLQMMQLLTLLWTVRVVP